MTVDSSNALKLQEIVRRAGAQEYVLNPDEIVFDFRAIMKCGFCQYYGKKMCPPGRFSAYDYEGFLSEYTLGILTAYAEPYTIKTFQEIRENTAITLQSIVFRVERVAFGMGYHWAQGFIGGHCRCCDSQECNDGPCTTGKGRPSLEGIGVDVIETCNAAGIPIEPFPHPKEKGTLTRVGLVMIE